MSVYITKQTPSAIFPSINSFGLHVTQKARSRINWSVLECLALLIVITSKLQHIHFSSTSAIITGSLTIVWESHAFR